jgi:carbamoyl-phosphate synthase large subunit
MLEHLVRMGCDVYATEGTAQMIQDNGMPVQMVTKRIGLGRPDMLDVILDGVVHGVINTPGPAEKEVLDGFQIRRAAVEKGIPCITSIDTAKAVVNAMRLSTGAYSVQPLPSYRNRVPVGY